MKRLKQWMAAATRRAHVARTVPMLVPHGDADASRDFECAFETLQGDQPARELWRDSAKIPFARAP